MEGFAPSFPFYIAFAMVPGVLTYSLVGASTRGLFMNAIPSEHVGKALGIFSVLVRIIVCVSINFIKKKQLLSPFCFHFISVSIALILRH
jgi:hypothetical protein